MPEFLRSMLAVAFLAAYATTASTVDATSQVANPLNDLRFVGQAGEKGKGNHHEDAIAFGNGTFRARNCENWGFGAGPYTVDKSGDAYHFKATLTSPDRGKLEWTGTIVGDKAIATFRWTHERWYGTIRRDYWFEGTRQAEKH
jgi:hypothetical protein